MRFFLICLLLSHLTFSQFEYGIKGGLNFDSAGKITKQNDDVISNGSFKSESGLNIGVYAQVNLLLFYLRPELQYTNVKRSISWIQCTSKP